MRLDLFLKVSRLIKRRAIAKKLCDAGKVHINQNIAKASKEIKEGDEISIEFSERKITFQVQSIPQKKNVTKADANELYEIIK